MKKIRDFVCSLGRTVPWDSRFTPRILYVESIIPGRVSICFRDMKLLSFLGGSGTQDQITLRLHKYIMFRSTPQDARW